MKLKTRAAIIASKGAKLAFKAVRRKGTHNIGVLAQKIDSTILRDIPKPKKIMAVTGTNGKTTTNNLIMDTLKAMGVQVMGNSLGSNIYYGIISALVNSASITGAQPEVGVLEIDELWSRHIFKDLIPDTLTIINILQDSYERNANVFFIQERLTSGIPEGVKLIINGDCAISAHLNLPNEKVFFSISQLPHERECYDSKVQDVIYCPHCDQKVTWSFKRYHHLGKYQCPECGFSEPEATYVVTSVDFEKNQLSVLDHGEAVILPLIQSSIESIYNQLAAYATLRENGYEKNSISRAMEGICIVQSRHSNFKVGNKNIIRFATKRFNPVAQSRVCDSIGRSDKPKTVILLENHKEIKELPMRTPGGHFATNFGYLNNNLNKLIISGPDDLEIKLVCLMDGMPEDKIVMINKEREITNFIDRDSEEEIIILHDIDDRNVAQAQDVENILKDYLGG